MNSPETIEKPFNSSQTNSPDARSRSEVNPHSLGISGQSAPDQMKSKAIAKRIDTSLSPERFESEKLMITDDLQQVKNKLEYDRSLTEPAKEELREFAKRRENDLKLLKIKV